MTLLEWVANVRHKFCLVPNPPTGQSSYWKGYADCLDDVERFAHKAEREATDVAASTPTRPDDAIGAESS